MGEGSVLSPGRQGRTGLFPFVGHVLSVAGFFVEFTLSGVRFFASLRMIWREGLRITASEGFKVRMILGSDLT